MKKLTYSTMVIDVIIMELKDAILAESNEQSSWELAGEDEWSN